MGHKLLTTCGLFLFCCVISIHGQTRRRLRTPAPRTTVAPSTLQPTPTPAAKASGRAQRKAAAVAGKTDRRNRGNQARTLTRDGVGVPAPIVVIAPPTTAGPILGSPTKGGQSVNLPDGSKVSSTTGLYIIKGFQFEECLTIKGLVLIPVGYFICCDGTFYENLNKNNPKACCGSDYYLVNSEICCDGFYYPKIDPVVVKPTACCADVYYIPALEICCGGNYDDKFNYKCCNGQFYNFFHEECCDGVKNKKVFNHACCGVFYGPSESVICCGGHPVHSFYQDCCHDSAPFYKFTQHCCQGGVVKHHGENC